MNRGTIVGVSVGILLAAGIVGTLGCWNQNAPWCSFFFAAEENPIRQLANGIAGNNNNGTGGATSETGQDPVSGEKNIVVTSPKPNEEVGLPLVLRGEARVFENAFSYRLKDENGSVLIEGHATAKAADTGEFGPFEVLITYPKPKGDRGTLEVYSGSPKDGTEINKVIIPVQFEEVESTSVKVFFGNKKEDPSGLECGKTHAVERRVPKTNGTARAALEELLKGPTAAEAGQGFFTSINNGVAINSLAIGAGGKATVDFSAGLQAGVGGACRVEAIRAQITETLKQFSSIKNVTISINGEVEGILQP